MSNFRKEGKTLHVEVGEVTFNFIHPNMTLHLYDSHEDQKIVFGAGKRRKVPATKYTRIIVHYGEDSRTFAVEKVDRCCASICPSLLDEITE